MLDFDEKRIFKKIIYSKQFIFVLMIAFLLMAKGVWGAYKDNKITRENLATAKNQLAELEKKEKDIVANIDDLKTSEGKEREIRDKFRVAKEGEKMIMIVNSSEGVDKKQGVEKNFFQKFFSVLGF